MTLLLLAAVTALIVPMGQAPCLYWTEGLESRAALEKAGIKRLCVAPEQVDGWRAAGFSVNPITPAELAARELLPPPGVTPRAGLASPTRSPWIVASGWRFNRHPQSKYVYDVPTGKAALAAAETYAYGADVVLKIDPADVGALGGMLTFLEGLPTADLPTLADLAVVEDGTAVTLCSYEDDGAAACATCRRVIPTYARKVRHRYRVTLPALHAADATRHTRRPTRPRKASHP